MFQKHYLKKYVIPAGAGVIFIAVIFSIGYYAGQTKSEIEKVTSLTNKEEGKTSQVDFSPFWKAWNVLNEKYVPTHGTSTEKITDEDKLWGAIAGLTGSLDDPYTVFFPPADSKIFEGDINGNFEGVGMEIAVKDGVLTVVSPLKGTPAYRAGIKSGDKILKIDDTVSGSLNSDEAVKLIRGKRGTPVVFTILRVGKKDTMEIKVIRDVIDIPTIDTELRSDGIFVIKLYNFSAVSPNLFRDALRKFVGANTNKLILDLRGNPGGYLEAAIDMASWFLPSGKIVVKEDFGPKKEAVVYRSKGYDIFNETLKLAILVNGGSASASEILAGALEENGVGKLVGSDTFGKGSVQELIKITPDTSLKVTVARWLTPDGISISEGGLKPEYQVKMTEDDVTAGKDPQMSKAVEILLKK